MIGLLLLWAGYLLVCYFLPRPPQATDDVDLMTLHVGKF
jgi:hypothetical protein